MVSILILCVFKPFFVGWLFLNKKNMKKIILLILVIFTIGCEKQNGSIPPFNTANVLKLEQRTGGTVINITPPTLVEITTMRVTKDSLILNVGVDLDIKFKIEEKSDFHPLTLSSDSIHFTLRGVAEDRVNNLYSYLLENRGLSYYILFRPITE